MAYIWQAKIRGWRITDGDRLIAELGASGTTQHGSVKTLSLNKRC
jgi:hypothetical protein